LSACRTGNLTTIKHLVTKGFDIHRTNINGSNAYLLACKTTNIMTLEYLESIGIDIHKTNSNGFNALLVACELFSTYIMKYLENIGFDYNYTTPTGINVFTLAKTTGNIKLINYIEGKKNVYDILSKYQIDFVPTENCLICFNIDSNVYIKCKHNHFVHLLCQINTKKNNCLCCFEDYC
jgi:ankyrin repeat protein